MRAPPQLPLQVLLVWAVEGEQPLAVLLLQLPSLRLRGQHRRYQLPRRRKPVLVVQAVQLVAQLQLQPVRNRVLGEARLLPLLLLLLRVQVPVPVQVLARQDHRRGIRFRSRRLARWDRQATAGTRCLPQLQR